MSGSGFAADIGALPPGSFPGRYGHTGALSGPLPDRVHPDAGLDQRDCPYAVERHVLVGVVRVLAHEFHIPLAVGFLNVFHRHVLLAVDVDRQQIHVAPEDIVDVAQLFVEYDVAAFE